MTMRRPQDLPRDAAATADVEARLAFALEAAEIAAWDWNPRTGEVWWSPTLEALYGVTPADRTRPWRTFGAVIHPDDRAAVKAAIFETAERGGGWQNEHRIAGPRGWRWIHFRGRATPGPDGRPARISGVCWEVTERRRMEAALAESEARFRDAAEASCDWVWETDAEHRFTYVFDRTGAIETPAQWFVGRSVVEVMAGTVEEERLQAHLADLAAERPFRGFVYWIRRARGWRCCSISGQPVRDADGRFRGYRGVGTDVTDQRRAEERLELALAGSEGFLWDLRFDPAGDPFAPVEVYLDPGAKAILGFGPDELNDVAAWHERVHPEDRARLRATIEDYFAGRRAGYEVEYRARHREGAFRWISSRGRLTRDPDGRPIRMTGVVWDVTARKEAEERQRLLLAELDHRVKNTLSRVQSILTQSLRGAASMEEFARAFEGRIAATARAHNLLTRESWRGADLRSLALEELAPYADAGNVTVEGEPLRLPAAAAVSFSMAFHELTTNAAKYGALSRPGGQVEVRWRREGDRLILTWEETGGPPVPAAPRRGFGSLLIERGLAYELRGAARIEFRAEGVFCRVEAPLEEEG
jgi:PAS domain S-box-containing protein